MYRNVWKACHKSICSINFFSKEGINIITLTGFKVENFILTDEFAHRILNAKDVVIKFVEADGITEFCRLDLAFWEFQDRILNCNHSSSQGFAILNIEGLNTEAAPGLKLASDFNYEIGSRIALLGFQIDQQNLAIKTGIISSFFVDKNSKRYIQFESSLKQGNSGAPLIMADTLEVVGIVGHRLASIAQTYNQLLKIINKNIKTLEEVEGVFNIQQLDPVQVLIANQNQMKHLTKEFFKLLNFRYGFATDISEVYECLEDLKVPVMNFNKLKN
jgi:hypothetical protein